MWLLLQASADTGVAGPDAANHAADLDKTSEGLLIHMLPYIILGASVVLCTSILKIYNSGTLPCQFLGDVVYWTMAAKRDGREADGTTTGAAAAAVPALPATSGSKKKTRKLQQQQHLSVTQQRSPLLQAGHLYPKLLLLLEFTEELDQMLKLFIVFLVNFAAAMLLRVFLTPTLPTYAFNLLITGWGFVLFTLYKVEWAHVIISKDEKMYMVAGALLGAVVCYALLVWVPPQALAFHAAAASEEATSRMALLVRSRFKNLPAAELQPIKDAGPLGAALAVVGGALTGLLMAPGIRYGRVLQNLLEPPVWAMTLRPTLLVKLMAQGTFALQLMITPLWITTMTDVLRIPDAALSYLRGMLMLLVALLQTALVPYLLQAFLYSTPLHEAVVTKNPGVSEDTVQKSVKRVAQVTLSQASKVCLQLLFVPALMMTGALGYLLLSFVSPLAETSPHANEWDKKPSVMLMCLGGFVGWWSSTVFMFWAGLGVLLSRLHSAALAS